jgi:hypothetical protein
MSFIKFTAILCLAVRFQFDFHGDFPPYGSSNHVSDGLFLAFGSPLWMMFMLFPSLRSFVLLKQVSPTPQQTQKRLLWAFLHGRGLPQVNVSLLPWQLKIPPEKAPMVYTSTGTAHHFIQKQHPPPAPPVSSRCSEKVHCLNEKVHCLNKKGTNKRKDVKKGKKRKDKAKIALKGVKYIKRCMRSKYWCIMGQRKKFFYLGVMVSYRPNKDRCLDV